MTPLDLDNYIRCVQWFSAEEWYAYSSETLAWFLITLEKAEWILSMTPAFTVNIAIAWCRENHYTAALRDSSDNLVFEKSE